MKRFLLLLCLSAGFATAANVYVFSLTQNKTLCTANKVNNSGTIELQMRCYDTTTSVPSYRMLINTSIFDTVLVYAEDITCLFQFDAARQTAKTQCSGMTRDTNGNIISNGLILDTTYDIMGMASLRQKIVKKLHLTK